MRANKLLLAFLLTFVLSASAFGQWVTQETTANTLNDIDGIVISGMATICAIGETGTVEVTTDYGNTWILKTYPGDVALQAVSIVDGRLYIAGGDKIYYSTNYGDSWSSNIAPPGVFFRIHDIDFGNSSNGVACGEDLSFSRTLRYTINGGTLWSEPTSGTPEVICEGVYFTDSDTVIVVGASGRIYKSDNSGQSWTREDSGSPTSKLNAVHFADTSNGFAVGNAGTFLKTTNGGDTWTTGTTPDASSILNGVHFVDANHGWAVGSDTGGNSIGKVYYTSDGGSSWTPELTEISGTPQTFLNGVYFTDINNGWTVGKGGSGIIWARIQTFEVTSVVQTARPTQHQAPRGFTGDISIEGTNFQVGSWVTDDVTFSGTGITVNSVTRDSSSKLTANISIDALATVSSRDVTVDNIDGSSDTLGGGFAVTALPNIGTIAPEEGAQGEQNLDIHISGNGFQDGCTVSFIPQGGGTGTISVDPVTFNGPSDIQTQIDISANATLGGWDAYVENPDGGTSEPILFTVVSSIAANNPTIADVIPNEVFQGQTYLLTIEGTNFATNAVVALSNDGITLFNTTWVSATQLTTGITVSATAPPGPRTVNVTNPGLGSASLIDAFTVLEPGAVSPTIKNVTPGEGVRGTTIEVTVSGERISEEAEIFFEASEEAAAGGSSAFAAGSGSTAFVAVPNGIIKYPWTYTYHSSVTGTGYPGISVWIYITDAAPTVSMAVKVVNPNGGYRKLLSAFTVIENARGNPAQNPRNLLVGGNPVNWDKDKKITIQYDSDVDGYADVVAFDLNGRPVARCKNKPIEKGTGRKLVISDANGEFNLEPAVGFLVIKISGTTPGITKSSVKAVIVRNQFKQ